MTLHYSAFSLFNIRINQVFFCHLKYFYRSVSCPFAYVSTEKHIVTVNSTFHFTRNALQHLTCGRIVLSASKREICLIDYNK